MTDISTPSADYARVLDQWVRCRDTVAGADAVKAKATKYLPKPSSQSDADYASFRARALYYGAPARTVNGLTGLVMRKDPFVALPPAMEEFRDAITPDGLTITDLLEEVLRETLTVSYGAILADHPTSETGTVTVAQARAMGLRPYLVLIRAEAIIGVEFGVIAGRRQIIRARIQEADDRIRELYLDEAGRYTVRIHTRVNGAWLPSDPIVPLRQGQPMTAIPMVLFSDRSNTSRPREPMLLPLVDVSLHHYQISADLSWIAHFSSLPVATICGVEAGATDNLVIGPNQLWSFESPDVKISYLEHSGTSITALRDLLKDDEGMMSQLGSRMIAPERAGVEAAEALALRQAGETSTLAAVANAVSRNVERALGFVRDWLGIDGDIEVKLNVDFVPGKMTAAELQAATQAVAQGLLSHRSFFDLLVEGEIIRPGRSYEDEVEDIRAQQIDQPVD